jgi:Fur family ferric uptake transcriptional regulator
VRYEQQYKTAHHDHMICVRCGRTIEFVNIQIERLQEKVAEKYDFQMTHHRMEIFGICDKCQRKIKPGEELL